MARLSSARPSEVHPSLDLVVLISMVRAVRPSMVQVVQISMVRAVRPSMVQVVHLSLVRVVRPSMVQVGLLSLAQVVRLWKDRKVLLLEVRLYSVQEGLLLSLVHPLVGLI